MKVKDTKMICPACRGNTVHRSHMIGFLERGILKRLGVHAFRCEACDARFYGYGYGPSGRVEETAGGTRKK